MSMRAPHARSKNSNTGCRTVQGVEGIDHEGAAGLAMRAQFFPAFFVAWSAAEKLRWHVRASLVHTSGTSPVCLVYLVYLVCLVSLGQATKQTR